MKKFDRIKTVQMMLLIVITTVALAAILRNRELFTLIAMDPSARFISLLLWLTLGTSFLFLLYDFSSYADLRRENRELDNAVYSDALTGIANRYSVDAYIGQFINKPLPEDMGAVTMEITNLAEINHILGHSGGDLIIRAFSEILQNAAGEKCFVGRNGGNKFVAFIRDCTDEKLEAFTRSVAEQTKERNDAHEDAKIIYSTGTAFNEGAEINDLAELVALSDRRAAGNRKREEAARRQGGSAE